MEGTRQRLPKLYADDDHSPFLRDWGLRRAGMRSTNVFDDARLNPDLYGILGGREMRHAEVIRALTGYTVVFARNGNLHLDGWNRACYAARPILESSTGRHRWYFMRDLLALQLPVMPRCEGCQKRRWDAATAPGTWCTRKCVRFMSSQYYAQFSERECRRYREHLSAPVCSQACHDIVEAEYRRFTLELWETRKWIEQGTVLLNEVRALLPAGYARNRRRASPSQRAASTPLTTSATS